MLHLAYNDFKYIAPGDFAHLSIQTLYIDHCESLSIIEHTAFWDLPLLNTLHLHSNRKLYFIDSNAFLGLPSLSTLLLHDNSLVTLSEDLISVITQYDTNSLTASPRLPLSRMYTREQGERDITNLWQVNSPSTVPSQVDIATATISSSNSSSLSSPSLDKQRTADDDSVTVSTSLVNTSTTLLSPSYPSHAHVNNASQVTVNYTSDNISSTENTASTSADEDKMNINVNINSQEFNHRKLHLSLGGNPLLCDCNIRYLLQVSFISNDTRCIETHKHLLGTHPRRIISSSSSLPLL